jgi:hypothetical protein
MYNFGFLVASKYEVVSTYRPKAKLWSPVETSPNLTFARLNVAT